MKLRFISMIIALGVLLTLPAFALDLHQARDTGILGEKNDGYVKVLKKSPEAEILAKEVNNKRKQAYARISKQNGQPVDVIASRAALQIVEGINTGNQYQDSNGNWKTR